MIIPRNCSSDEKRYLSLCAHYKEEPVVDGSEKPLSASAHALQLKARWDAERTTRDAAAIATGER